MAEEIVEMELPDIKTFVDTFNGAQRTVFAYITDEILHSLTEEQQDFLLQTSILDNLHPSLCNAVTEQHNGDEMLAWLNQADLFLAPLAYREDWYRYAPLFAEALQFRLKQKYQERIFQLHLRASHWYKQHELSMNYIYNILTTPAQELQAPTWMIHTELESHLLDKLSERELMVLRLIAAGLSNQEIAQRLVVSVSTIKTHLNNIYAKLHVHTRLQAVTRAYEIGLLLRHNELETYRIDSPRLQERRLLTKGNDKELA